MKKIIIWIVIVALLLPVSSFAYSGINTNIKINEQAAKSSNKITSSILGTLQVLGSIISVAALVIIGIRYMFSGLEEKAQMKGVVIYYIIGAVLVFATSNILGIVYNAITNLSK